MSRSLSNGKWLTMKDNFMGKGTEVLNSSGSVRVELKEMAGSKT